MTVYSRDMVTFEFLGFVAKERTRDFIMKTWFLAVAMLVAASTVGWAEGSKVDFDNGSLLYYDADCDGPHECTFAMVGCEYETPSISFSMDQEEVSAWFAKSNGRVLLKVGQVSIEMIASEIEWGDMDDDWWPSIFTGNESEMLWGLLRPGQTLEIVAGPKQLNLVIPKQIDDVHGNCKRSENTE